MINVSIVIPTFNRPQLLDRCLASLSREIHQHSEFEILVADDGSFSDNAGQNALICDKHGARYLGTSVNSGMAIARNRGISASTGAWIVFLDDDVTCDTGWFSGLTNALHNFDDVVVGFEGMVNPSGNGLWDREVQNRTGGAFITCHFGVRRSILNKTGLFDEYFSVTGPYCEDHEFAARLGRWGAIAFCTSFSITHAPRTIHTMNYFRQTPRRTIQLLTSDCYFFSQHPDRYHLFRSHRHFLGTLCSFLFRNIFNTLKRRTLSSLLFHPCQAIVLIAGSILEQICAWIFLARLLRAFKQFHSPLQEAITKTSVNISGSSLPDTFQIPRIKRSIGAFAKLLATKKSSYKLVPCKKTPTAPADYSGRLYLRIDDMFLMYHTQINEFCTLLKEQHCPFLAAVTCSDLCAPGNTPIIQTIIDAGGEIGIHGFTHKGTFGPYKSELLQMTMPEIHSALDALENTSLFSYSFPQIFVPPYNAISAQQIIEFSGRFNVITGGPETARFTDYIAGSVAITKRCRYIPSFPPFYGTAASILRSGCLDKSYLPRMPIVLTTHFTDEIKDSFRSLRRLLAAIPCSIQPWNRLY